MRKVNRINWLTSVIIGVMCIGTLTACGGRSSNSGSTVTTVPPATIAPKATVAPQQAQPAATSAPAQPTTAPTVERPTATSAPTITLAPAATATSAAPAKSTTSGAALDQVLEQLFNANNSADQLNDVPQLK